MNILTSMLIIMGIGTITSSTTLENPSSTQKVSPKWYIVNDGVMGGLSNGLYMLNSNENGVFKGTLSLENNGGFSWLKSRPENWDLKNAEGVKIKVKADGRKYSFTMKNGERRRSLYFAHPVETKKNEWVELDLPFKDFKGYFYGQNIDPLTRMDLKLMSELGFIIMDKKEGSFELEIGEISFY